MRKHFFELLERKIDYQFEYEKLEEMVVVEHFDNHSWGVGYSINDCIEQNFRSWKKRGRYTTFQEVRDQVGVGFYYKNSQYYFQKDIDIEKYFAYCEMLLNVLYLITGSFTPYQHIQDICDTIKATVEDSGFEIRTINETIQIVEKDAVAIEVAEIVPELSDVIIEYNHYLLRGDIQRKRELLKHIADALEPKRRELEVINNTVTSDFFNMINNMNIRHNNIDPSQKGRYVPGFANLTNEEQESWYDIIYEQALTLFVLLGQQERTKRVKDFLSSIRK